jgi:hypothetical protein
VTSTVSDRPASAVTGAKWRETYAYTLGVQAYLFGFPWLYLTTVRWQWVTQPRNPERIPYAPLNEFWHARHLIDATYRDGGAPNNDTLYSLAWLDVGTEPVILSVPEVDDRYYAIELASMDSDNFAYVGVRTTGPRAGNHAVVGPRWRGELPSGVRPLEPSRTPSVLVAGRTAVDGPGDLPAVHAVQDRYRLTPLSAWGRPDARRPARRDVLTPAGDPTDPLGQWRTMNAAMTENPPQPRHDELLRLFATIGVGPGMNVDEQSDEVRTALGRAAGDARAMMKRAAVANDLGRMVNGWLYPAPTLGRAGVHDDLLTRAIQQCMVGLVANDPEEAVYLVATTDAAGRALDGAGAYELRFAAGELPPVNAFWSLTMYEENPPGLHNFVDNPARRYSIGDRTPNLGYGPDGSLTLCLRADPPGGERDANWLPAPDRGHFMVILRTYVPGEDIIAQRWRPPAVRRCD